VTAVLLGEVTVAGRPECVGLLRTATRVLAALVDLEATDAAVLICSELSTNAVRHSRSSEPGRTMMLRVHDEGQTVRIAITDQGSPSTRPEIPTGREQLTANGHGLFLVQALSKEWGVEYGTDGSTTVWSRIEAATPEEGDEAPLGIAPRQQDHQTI
jgi:anti-sigma regulatory factor (Ser/Thr protein kinase)